MKKLIASLQFLTILPVGKTAVYEPVKMIPFFPVVGLIIGGFLSIFDHLALKLWPIPVVSVLDIVFLVVITAALHLDGLGDTADGLLGHRNKEKALEIMKDSRIGVMGLTAIVCSLAVKWSGIMNLHHHRELILVLVPAYARSGMLFGIFFLDYGRSSGTGYDLFGKPITCSSFACLSIPIVLSFFLGWKFIWLNFTFAVTTMLIILYYKYRIGCITGDMLGAMTEILESVLFLLICV